MASDDKRRARLERDMSAVRALLTSRGVDVGGYHGPRKEVSIFLYLATSRASPVLGRTEIIACIGIQNDWYVVRPRALRATMYGAATKAEAMSAIVRTAAR